MILLRLIHNKTAQMARQQGVRQYMDVRTRPSHSQMFDKRTGRVSRTPPQTMKVRMIPTTLSVILPSAIAIGMMTYWWKNRTENDESSKQNVNESK
jgi:hypothetical protein